MVIMILSKHPTSEPGLTICEANNIVGSRGAILLPSHCTSMTDLAFRSLVSPDEGHGELV